MFFTEWIPGVGQTHDCKWNTFNSIFLETACYGTHGNHGTGIFNYTFGLSLMVNVGKYTSHMDPMGICITNSPKANNHFEHGWDLSRLPGEYLLTSPFGVWSSRSR